MSKEEVTDGLEALASKLQQKQGIAYHWQGDKVVFSHKAGKGSIEVVGQDVILKLKLGLLYAAMAPAIKKQIQIYADHHIH